VFYVIASAALGVKQLQLSYSFKVFITQACFAQVNNACSFCTAIIHFKTASCCFHADFMCGKELEEGERDAWEA
jgi:hypothetical protein